MKYYFLGLIALILGLAWLPFFYGTDADELNQIIARDAQQRYEIAKRHGSALDACTQAGFVAHAFLQAKDEENYAAWRAIERQDCLRVGIRR